MHAAILAASVALLASGCVASAPDEPVPGTLELIESFPVETSLDQPDLRDAHAVWPELIASAETSIACAWFYVSDEPPSRLGPFLAALEQAAARGVRVEILADAGFHATYPRPLDDLDALENVEVRLFDVKALTGGVLHAKYFLIDGEVTFLGSQNCDWRALEHIQELGVLVRSEAVTAAFAEQFRDDWHRAGGEPPPAMEAAPGEVELSFNGERVLARPVASPRDWVADPERWDLPHLVRMIDAARERVRVQLLTYRPDAYDGTRWDELDGALRAAAGRGVTVQLLVADWGKRKSTIGGLQRLTRVDGVEVRMATIPPWSGGFVPFGRVIHSKYMVVDGRAAWIGTSNWERGYFYASRNVGLVLEGESVGERLDRYFEAGWNSEYAEAVDPERTYEAPRIGP